MARSRIDQFYDRLTPGMVWRSLRSRPPLLALLAIVVAHGPILMAYGTSLAGREHYAFFPVVWIALIAFVWLRADRLTTPAWHTLLLLLADAGLVLAAGVLNSPWLGYTGFCGGCAAVLAVSRDRTRDGSLLVLLLLPLLTLRPPLSIDAQIVTRLQLLSAQAASAILARLDLLHYRMGVVLRLPSRDLFVDEACSGIQSLFTLLCLAALIVIIQHRHWVLSTLLMVTAPLWAVMLNIVRITVIVAADARFGWDLSTGWGHDVLGYSLVVVSLLCLLSTDRLLLLCTLPIPITEEIDSEPYDSNPFVRYFNRIFAPRMGVPEPAPFATISRPQLSFLVAAGGCFLVVQLFGFDVTRHQEQTQAVLRWYKVDCLQAAYGDWTCAGYSTEVRNRGSAWGERSCQWEFTEARQTAKVSLDYPFLGWHELSQCYTNSGWQIIRTELRQDDSESDWKCVLAVMQDELGNYGLLCYSVFDGDGNPVPPAWDTVSLLSKRWQRAVGEAVTYQAQVFLQTAAPTSPANIEQIIRLHLETRHDLRTTVTVGTAS